MKKVVVGVLLLLILAGITIWVTKQDRSSTMRTELTDFAIEDTASITRIVLKDQRGERVELSRSNGDWLLNGEYQARTDAIKNLLVTMKKLAVKAPITETMKNTVLKNIIASHTLVEVYDGSDLIKTYYVGGPDKEHTGTFMMIKGSSRPFLMHIEGFHGFLTPRYFTNPNEWRHRGIYELDKEDIKSVEVDYITAQDKNFSIERQEDGRFNIFSGADRQPVDRLDTFMLSAYLANFEMIHFEGFEETKTEQYVDSVVSSEPIFRISVTEMDGSSTEVLGYRKPLKDGYDPMGNEISFDLDRLYLRVDSDKIVVGQYAIFDKLTKGIGFIPNR